MPDRHEVAADSAVPSVLEFASIDDYLGPSSQRFFGSGYRRSTYHIHPEIGAQDLAATVDVSYPADWSQKGTGPVLRPHLSTVDAMILGMRSAEALLCSRFGLTGEQLQSARVQKLTVQAGTRPDESLVDLPLRAQIKRTQPSPLEDDGQAETTVTAQVGGMRTSIVLRHDAPSGTAMRTIDYGFLEERADRYWASGYRYDDQELTAVSADLTSLKARSVARIRHGATGRARATYTSGGMTLIHSSHCYSSVKY